MGRARAPVVGVGFSFVAARRSSCDRTYMNCARRWAGTRGRGIVSRGRRTPRRRESKKMETAGSRARGGKSAFRRASGSDARGRGTRLRVHGPPQIDGVPRRGGVHDVVDHHGRDQPRRRARSAAVGEGARVFGVRSTSREERSGSRRVASTRPRQDTRVAGSGTATCR
eukprot:31209-Pelagococcus_subviridis.AAC.11